MKKMIRILAAALAAACTLSLAAWAAEPEEVPAAELVTELGLMEAEADGDFAAQGAVTREEMARIVCLLLNGGKDPSFAPQEDSLFSDTQGRPLGSYVDYCANMGIVSGRGDGTFGPEDPLTGTAAAKMLLVCLGYDAGYEGFQSHEHWDVNVGVQASAMDLFEGVDTNFPEAVSRGDLARLIWNALNMERVKYEYKPVPDGNGGFQPVAVAEPREDGRTLLRDKFKLELVDGVLQPITEPEG